MGSALRQTPCIRRIPAPAPFAVPRSSLAAPMAASPSPSLDQGLPRLLPCLQRWRPGLFLSSCRHLPAWQGSPVAIPGALTRPHPAEQREQISLRRSSSWVHSCPVHGEAPRLQPAPPARSPSPRLRLAAGSLPGGPGRQAARGLPGPPARGCLCGTSSLPARAGSPAKAGGVWMAASPKAMGCSQPQGGCEASFDLLRAAPQ